MLNATISERIGKLSTRISEAEGKRKYIQEQRAAAVADLVRVEDEALTLEKAQAFIQKIAAETQKQLKVRVEDIAQLCIDTAFDRYKFEMIFEFRAGRSEIDLVLKKPDGRPFFPVDSNGGGLVDLLAFGLRVAAWSLDKVDNVLILDEPMKWLDKPRVPLAAKIIRELSERLKLQIIYVTHIDEMVEYANRVFFVRLDRHDISDVEEISKDEGVAMVQKINRGESI